MSPVLLISLILALAAGVAALSPRDGALAMRRAVLGAGLAFVAALATLGAALIGGGDPLALALSGLTAGIATVVLGFSQRHLRADPDRRGFAVRALLLAAMVPAFAGAGNLVLFAGAWMASGLLLAALVGHRQGWAEAREAASRTRVAFAVGDAALVVAFALLGFNAGTLELAGALAGLAGMPAPEAVATAGLLLLAAMSRSALPPFSGWLTGSMAAPTPVSALMHGGLVNAGGFLLVRFAPVLEAAPALRWATIAAGTVAVLWGLGIAMVRTDTKRALAGSTVAQMGFSFLCCGLGAYAAAIWHLVAHGLFKAWLFLGAGSTIGQQSDPALPTGSVAVTAGGAAVGVATAVAMAVLWPTPELLPIALAVATASAALLAAVRHPLGLRGGAVLAGGGLVYLAGLAGFSALIPHAAVPLAGGIVASLLLFAAFVALWLAQASGRALPTRLYVRLAAA